MWKWFLKLFVKRAKKTPYKLRDEIEFFLQESFDNYYVKNLLINWYETAVPTVKKEPKRLQVDYRILNAIVQADLQYKTRPTLHGNVYLEILQ